MEDKLCIFPQENKITGLYTLQIQLSHRSWSPKTNHDLLNPLQIHLIRIDRPLMTNQFILHPPNNAINHPLITLKM